MTPKEKAEELHRKFWTGKDLIGENLRITTSWSSATQCALIVVDEVLSYSKAHGFIGLTEYWEEVKQEIEKL